MSASSESLGGFRLLGDGKLPDLTLLDLTWLMMTGLSSLKSLFLPQFSLALSGGMPVPPLSMDQGALPAGQGYSYKYFSWSSRNAEFDTHLVTSPGLNSFVEIVSILGVSPGVVEKF